MTRKRSPTDLGPIYLDIQDARSDEYEKYEIPALIDVIKFQKLLRLSDFSHSNTSQIEKFESAISNEQRESSNHRSERLEILLQVLCKFTQHGLKKNGLSAAFDVRIESQEEISVLLSLNNEKKITYALMTNNPATRVWLENIKDQLALELGVRLAMRAIVSVSETDTGEISGERQDCTVSYIRGKR